MSLRARGLVSACPVAVPAGQPPAVGPGVRRCGVLAEARDDEVIIERIAAVDVGKAELACCVRVPDERRPRRRLQEVEVYPAMTRALLRLADRLRCLGVRRVVMEATSDYVRRDGA
jgi:transposase